ncbi:MAG: deoxyribodipyrimidine photolyase [Cytophagales bacterium]|nr:MAG: deoxyribodipyrimidine photolyase [Cytophagales bacterium]
MQIIFDTNYLSILEKIHQINPVEYGKTRNYIDGAVTYLSPYISRGVISTKQVLEITLQKGYKISQIEAFVKELCWRDYFQRVGQLKNLFIEIKQPQSPVFNYLIPSQVVSASTNIEAIDNAIRLLYQTGYMHNHHRMYIASIVCNIAKSHWLHPAQWMYYHLLDGDWASNACSWQWVAGANSNKKYFANQENINTYTKTNQKNTFLDHTYEIFEHLEIPNELSYTHQYDLQLTLPNFSNLNINNNIPTYIYNYYNLDPLWHKEEIGNRILLIDPNFYRKYPVSKKCIDFMLALSRNIPNIQFYTGSFESLMNDYDLQKVYFKEHPSNIGYFGIQEDRDWICKEVSGYYPSFFAYWKKIESYLHSQSTVSLP